jgi:toxin secretion/phage lysis holin
MSTNNPTRVVTGEVRLSYAHVWEPNSIQGGKPKYSVSLIIPKTDTATITAIEKAIDAAIDTGTAKFGGKRPNKAALKLPLRDGDTERDDEAYANSFFAIADYITGVLAAINERRISSAVGFRGIARKILIFTLVGLAHLLDTQVIGTPGVLRTAVIFFYLSNEGISLIENATRLGLPIPAQMRDALDVIANQARRRPPLNRPETPTADEQQKEQ